MALTQRKTGQQHAQQAEDEPLTAQERIEQLEDELLMQGQVIKALQALPRQLATIAGVDGDKAYVVLKDQRYEVSFDPKLKGKMERGMTGHLNDHMAIVDISPPLGEGIIAHVNESLEDGRIKVSINGSPRIIEALASRGDSIILDESGTVLRANLGRQSAEYTLERVPQIPWSKIGGLDEVIEKLDEQIIAPFSDSEIFAKYGQKPPRGVLFYGPPGCGKTLLAKGLAYNLAQTRQERDGQPLDGYFLSIKGPEILSKWVGDSEGNVRSIFASAREKSKERGEPVVIFVDEADAILKRRGSGISTDIFDSIVPQFLAELDGMEDNYSVVLALATNRPDTLDPAIMRPGRIDRKIEIPRPGRSGAEQIFAIHLGGLPMMPNVLAQAQAAGAAPNAYAARIASEHLFAPDRILGHLVFAGGTQKPIHYQDALSGALIASTVGRAVEAAIRRERHDRSSGAQHGITLEDLAAGIDAEFRELQPHLRNVLEEADVRRIAGAHYGAIADIKPATY